MRFLYLFLLFQFLIINAKSQTNVSGTISNNTIWSKTNSPYRVTGNIIIKDSVVLTIEPGVSVLFDFGTYIELKSFSQLIARGTRTDSIRFTTTLKTPKYWNGIQTNKIGARILMDYCYCAYANTLLYLKDGPDTIMHSIFYKNSWAALGAGMRIDSCLFEENDEGASGAGSIVSNSYFINNARGARIDTILNCVFSGNTEYGAHLYNNISNCRFYKNNVGIYHSMLMRSTIEYCDIFDNNVGIEIGSGSQSQGVMYTKNKICHNTLWNVKISSVNNTSVANNCWCFNDSASIANSIRDKNDSLIYGLVNFIPYDTCGAPSTPTCNTPQNLKFTNISTTSMIAVWDSMPNVKNYQYTSYTPNMPNYGTTLDTNRIILDNLSPGTKYDICVRSRCGIASFSDWVCVFDSTAPSTLVQKISSANNILTLYPNPAKEKFTIDVKLYDRGSTFITITNSIGIVFYRGLIYDKKQEINIAGWANGVYIVKYQNDKETIQTRIIKE